MNSIEELISKYEFSKFRLEDKLYVNYMLSDNDQEKLRLGIEIYGKIIEDLKNLPNELRAVNRNEQAEEFCRFGYSKHDRCNNECNSTGCELK